MIPSQKNKKANKPFNVEEWVRDVVRDSLDEDCVDNYRWADISNQQELDAFDVAEAEGCCGSWTKTLVAPNGRTYKIGCNYGH